MGSRRPPFIAAAVIAALALVGLGAPAQAARPGKWTTISSSPVVNFSEPDMYRTADGVLHVAISTDTHAVDGIEVAHISPRGDLTGRTAAITNWRSVEETPRLTGAPGGGMRLVFGGLITGATSGAYNEGYAYYAASDASGAAWTLAPNTAPAIQDIGAYGSYGTGATQLADGTLVAAFPRNSRITYQVGANPPQSFSVPECCAYNVNLASDGGNVYAAWYANGYAAANRGVFVRQIHPVLGPTMQAPQSVTGGNSLAAGQTIAMAARPGGGVYLAYIKGYPGTKAVAVWRVGSPKPKLIKGSKGGTKIAMSAGSDGRLWVAFRDASNDIKVMRTNRSAKKFGVVQTVKVPKGTTTFRVAIEAGNGRADLAVNTGPAIMHTQVLPGLSVKASPRAVRAGVATKVTFKVTDAGAAVKGAKVKAKGRSCTTDNKGRCSITVPASSRPVTVKATKRSYATGQVTVKVRAR